MKYRTTVELICDAPDRDEAGNIAGEYLKGELDFGVEMKSKTESITAHKVRMYSSVFVIVVLALSVVLLKDAVLSGRTDTGHTPAAAFRSTYTIMPVLKTKHTEDFKKEWADKKDEAVLEYLKK